MNDTYNHTNSGVVYIEESIPGPSDNSEEFENVINDFNSQITGHCACNKFCTDDCSCLQRSGGKNYTVTVYNGEKRCLLNYESKDTASYSILECNCLCQCSQECGNRSVQTGPIEGLVVQTCCNESKGVGLFTKNFIARGSFICEYAGEIITKTEALKRHNKNSLEGKMNYIYCLKEHSDGKVAETFIDPSMFGNIGRYINHSCDPNCIIIPVRVDTPIPKLAIFSSKDILPNTELTYDYGSDNLELNSKNRKKCLCNSSNCRGWMPFEVY